MATRVAVRREKRETAGFVASGLFVFLASVRDVYLANLFQRFSPLHVAMVAFVLCTALFLPIALARHPQSLRELARRPRDVLWINATSAIAWISFFYALRAIEPSLVQVLFSGVGPLSIIALERFAPQLSAPAPLSRIERPCHLGILAALVLAASVAVGGLSGGPLQSPSAAALGVALATGAGISISINTVLCKRLNEQGVRPVALVGVRFIGAVLVAAALSIVSSESPSALFSVTTAAVLTVTSLVLIVFPIYVNQVGISWASPITVRVVLTLGPVLIFLFQLFEGRLDASPYSLATAALYCMSAVAATVARQRATRYRPRSKVSLQ